MVRGEGKGRGREEREREGFQRAPARKKKSMETGLWKELTVL
jgi:hypothetical protein